ncbi:MAG: mannose-1-phosphate guanylyltransferase/mannose-6-phosphate isomerase [Beijerinckiaceae bacterium]
MIRPTIMCGGAGTRLWPASRDSMPKHLLPLFDGLSTFQMTVLRFKDQPGFGRPTIITAADTRFLVGGQLADIGAEADMILEPSRQDSAAAVAVGATHLSAIAPGETCLILAADHSIADPAAFRAACLAAEAGAQAGHIMTLGIQPTAPATGYGYVDPGPEIAANCFKVKEFREKPDLETAKRYIAAGYLWTSGNFMFRPADMIAAFKAHAPAILDAASQAYAKAERDKDFIRLDAAAFAKAPKTSVDYAIMEKIGSAGVTPCDAGWSDIGTWDAMWDVSTKDAAGNAVSGDAVVVDSRNSLVRSDGMLVTAVGVEDMIVVAGKDAVMVAPKARAADVKKIVESLKGAGRSEATEHLRMFRPWGWYQRIDIGDGFQVKRIHVYPGGKLSLQSHKFRAEHWVVITGEAHVTIDAAVVRVRVNENVHLPLGCVHRLDNPHAEPVEIIEVQIGSYTGEDDIVRYEDIYGR